MLQIKLRVTRGQHRPAQRLLLLLLLLLLVQQAAVEVRLLPVNVHRRW
jgi:hypothetical protein